MFKKSVFFCTFVIITLGFYLLQKNNVHVTKPILPRVPPRSIPTNSPPPDPLSLQAMKAKTYPGSTLTIEQTLAPGSNYTRYLISYVSDGLKIFGLLTVPVGQKPPTGWPAILLNHGYIPPASYSTQSSYGGFIDPIATQGYIVFKPDFRGNGNSEGTPSQFYVTPDYVTDSMNALASLKKYPETDPHKIGVMGHSMGGNITLHELVISQDVKAAEILSGVVGNVSDILSWWNERIAAQSISGNDLDTAALVEKLVSQHQTPQTNPLFWNSLDPTHFIADITTPVEIQVGTQDTVVPPQFSTSLYQSLKQAGKTVTLKEYAGADHNLSPDTSQALNESITFFNQYLK